MKKMKKRCMAFLLTALFLCQPLLGLAEETAAALQIEDRVGERSGASFSLPQFGDEPEINQYYLELAARLEAGELPPGARRRRFPPTPFFEGTSPARSRFPNFWAQKNRTAAPNLSIWSMI